VTERTAGAILEKRLPGRKQSLHAQNIKSALDTLGEISTNLETLKNGNTEINAVVDESLAGVSEARVRVLDKVPQVIWIGTDCVDFSQSKEPEPVCQELIGEGHKSRHKSKDTDEGAKGFWDFCLEQDISESALRRIIKTNNVETFNVGRRNFLTQESQNRVLELVQKEKEKKEAFGGKVKGSDYSLEEHERLSAAARLSSLAREDQEKRTKKTLQLAPKSKIGKESSAKFEVKDLEAGNEYGEEDGQSLNIYFEEVRKTSFNTARTRTYARRIFKGEIALSQLEKILESGVLSGEISEKITALLSQPKAKYLLLNLKNTVKSNRDADKDKNQGSYLTAKSAVRQETWIRKKIENVSVGTNEEMGIIIANRIKTAKAAFESFDSLVGENLKLAANWAYKYRGKGLPVADLIGLGNEGLMTAAAKYNYKTGYGFSTYAVWWIRQRIKRGIIDTGQAIRLPVHVHETLSEISKKQKDLTQTFGREPTGLEVARKVGISITNYRTIMNARNTDSLNKIIGRSEDMELEDKVARVEVDYDGETYRTELREVMENALKQLAKRERQVVELRFGIGQNKRSKILSAVGEELGVSRERARQIEAVALRKLNSLLKTYVLGLRSNLLRNGRNTGEKNEAIDTRDIRAIKCIEKVEIKPPTVVAIAENIDAANKVDTGEIIEVAKMPILMSDESNGTEYCSPGEIISTLGITRQRWH